MHRKYAQQNTVRMEKILESSSLVGLTPEQATARLRKNGKNSVLSLPRGAVATTFGTVLKNGSLFFFVLALLLATPTLGLSVLFPLGFYLVFLAVSFAFSLIRSHGITAHKKALLPRVRVVRGGRQLRVSPEELAVGDLLLLSPGDILYTYAHVTDEGPLTVFCRRGGKNELFLKHGGDCFDGTDEPFNSLRPGDIIREGEGRAFVTFLADAPMPAPSPASETIENHGKMCDMASRISFLFAFLILAVGFLRACLASDYAILCESLLLSGSLVATTGIVFHSVLFDLLFLAKNKKTKEHYGGIFTSLADMELLTEVDSFVLSSRSIFRSAQYVARNFETASGKRISDGKRTTAELALIADALFAMQKKCELPMKEQAVLGFCASRCTVKELALYAKASDERYTHASFRNLADARPVSLVWGNAETLIPELMYFSEDGKVRVLDEKSKRLMLDGVRRLRDHGYTMLAFAETQLRNSPDAMIDAFADLKLLGFFALRKASDEQAERTLLSLKKTGKKVFFVHDGENADWLEQEIKIFSGVPVLDGNRESFREELAMFASDGELSFGIGINLTALQRAQIVQLLENTGYRVAAYGENFEDHRMMCAASASISPLKNKEAVPPLVMQTASALCEEHISSPVFAVRSAAKLLGSFGVLTASLCASLLGRSVLALLGVAFGVTLMPVEYYIFIGILFDLLSFYCFTKALPSERYGGRKTLARENRKNASLFVGFVLGSLVTGLLAVFIQLNASRFAFSCAAFVFFTLLMMMNVGMWRFSAARHSASMLLFPLASLVITAVICLLDAFGGALGFAVRPELFFWALFPTAAMMASGTVTESYLKQKFFDIEEKEKL